jgi:hypothetical protein
MLQIRCLLTFPTQTNSADAAEITETISVPARIPDIASISILGVASDGMTTYVYFEPLLATTFLGMNLPTFFELSEIT